jgi:phospholipid/cholesterol/gamma-HCH transport system substrate-binding protein
VRHGAELKVGLITLLAVALLALFTYYIRGSLGAKHTYAVFVLFDNARGLQQGDPVRMVGVKIGEVNSVKITPAPRKAQVMLVIDRQYPLYYNYTFQIAASGLIQERSIEVIPAPPGEEGLQLADQSKVAGTAAPDLSDLLQAGGTVLTSLQQTSEQLRSVMGDKELMGNVRKALESFALASDSARDLADTAAAIAQQSQPQTQEILTRLRMAAADMQSTTSAVRDTLQKGTTLQDLQETAANVRATSKNAERLSASIAELAGNPEVQGDLKGTVKDLRTMTATLKDVSADLKAFSGQLKEAAPSIPRVAKQAEQMTTTVTQLQERLKPPEMHADFYVLYSPKAGRSFSTANVDFNYPTMSQRFLRLGVDDIGEETGVNAQVGERMRLGAIRYGLVRSRLGIGFDYRPRGRAGVSVDLFNPNSLRADVMGDVPLANSDWSLMMGVRDLGKGNLYVVGGKVTR